MRLEGATLHLLSSEDSYLVDVTLSIYGWNNLLYQLAQLNSVHHSPPLRAHGKGILCFHLCFRNLGILWVLAVSSFLSDWELTWPRFHPEYPYSAKKWYFFQGHYGFHIRLWWIVSGSSSPTCKSFDVLCSSLWSFCNVFFFFSTFNFVGSFNSLGWLKGNWCSVSMEMWTDTVGSQTFCALESRAWFQNSTLCPILAYFVLPTKPWEKVCMTLWF